MFRVKRFLGMALLVCGLCVIFGGSALAVPADPVVSVKDTVDQIIAVLQDEKLSGPDKKSVRRSLVVDIVEKRFDFREMSMRTLARHWRDRTPAEQDKFVQLFTKLLQNTYIAKIETYSGEKVVFRKHAVQGDKAIVYSDLVRNNIETPVNYKLKMRNDIWMVYDVEVEGVSLVNNYRTQFSSILEKEKFAGLISRIEEKVNKGQTE